VTSGEIAELRALIGGRRAAGDAATAPGARARHVLREHALARIAGELAETGLELLLVKGAALALTHYHRPWLRDMADVDLVAPPGAVDRALAALVRAGCELCDAPAGRPLTAPALAERSLLWRAGALLVLVEVHSRLDKVVGRPVDYAAVMARSTPVPDLRGLRVPDPVDHALLVVLHAANASFAHPPAWMDLELLLRGGLDARTLRERARAWRAETALWIALSSLVALGSRAVPPELVAAIEPGRLRRLALARGYRVGSIPVRLRSPEPGVGWVVAQTPVRDDLGRWLLGLTGYGALRVLERILLARRVFAPSDAPAARDGAD
jgi:hypothetical protein